MKSLIAICLLAVCAPAESGLQAELARLDAAAADPDTKVYAVTLMAGRLRVHPNHVLRLRRESGAGFGEIFARELRARGESEPAVLAQVRAVNRELQSAGRESTGQLVLELRTGADHNSLGTFFSALPEVGYATRHASVVAGFPLYNRGAGDIYTTGAVYTQAGRAELRSSLTVGFPTGDRDKGLGAGKLSYDAAGGLAGALGMVRPFVTAGVTNSVFNNIGYQRPYVSTGTAFHLAGGAGFRPVRALEVGLGGFLVRPSGTQQVYSRVVETPAAGRVPPGHMRKPPVFEEVPAASVQPAELRDHGPNAWAVWRLHRSVWLETTVARSIPFQLTTVHFGIGFRR